MGSYYSNQKLGESEDTPEASIKRFQKYLQIKSAHPDPDYASIIKYLKQAAEEIGLDFKTLEEGQELERGIVTELKPLILVRYLEAVRSLKKEGKSFVRTIHLCFVPDEEVGGKKGMEPFVKSEQFKALNVGVSLDEGHPSPTMDYHLYYAERSVRSIDIRVTPRVDLVEFDKLIDTWIKNAGSDITYHFHQVGIVAYGLSLINDTPMLLHSNDEFINKDVFLKGIEIYKVIIPAFANTTKFEPDDPKETADSS